MTLNFIDESEGKQLLNYIFPHENLMLKRLHFRDETCRIWYMI